MVSSDKNARDGSARSFAIPTVANGVAVARLPRASGRPRDLATWRGGMSWPFEGGVRHGEISGRLAPHRGELGQLTTA